MSARPAIASALLLPLSLVLAPPAAAAAGGSLLWMFQGIEDVVCADVIQDQNSDGVPDVIVETYDAGATGDHLYCLSGDTPTVASVTIWSVKPPGGPSNSGGRGDECVRTTEDVSGDGIQDVLLGTAWGGRTAYAIDGTNGAVVWDFDTYVDEPPRPATSGWVYTITSIPDATGDGTPDVFFGCGSDNDRAYHVDGANGTVLWSQDLGDAIFASAAMEDVSGDGKADAAIGVGELADAVWMMRGGATTTPAIWIRPVGNTVQGLAAIEDLDGDTIQDVIGTFWMSDSTVIAFSGDDGSVIWSAGIGSYGMQVVVLDDVNSDTVPDVAVASWADQVTVLSGADGATIWTFPTGGDVWTVGRVEDANGDGINDVVGGSFDQNIYLLDGVTGAEEWRYGTGNRLYWVMGTPDLSGNGTPDVFGGSQKLSGPGGQGFLLEGGADATSADLPASAEAVSAPDGVQVRLRGAREADAARVERAEGALNDGPARAAFRSQVMASYEEGLLTAQEAMNARSHGPAVRWRTLGEVAVRAGGATFTDGTARTGSTYSYRFALLRDGEVVGYSLPVTITATDAMLDAIRPLRIAPNPSRGPVDVSFDLPRAQTWRLDTFDAAGRRVASRDGASDAGLAHVPWNGRDAGGGALAAGVYFLRLETEDYVTATKVTLRD